MNQSLQALMTKLNWQLNELNLQMQEVQAQLQSVNQHIQEIDDKVSKASLNSLTINPELEINRLNFVTQLHEQKDQWLSESRSHLEAENKLKEKIQRVKTELKMLEKYLEKEKTSQQEQQKKSEDNAMDEWVIQKREAI